jgi:hypothetical protein
MITWLREHKAVAIATFAAIGAVIATVLVPPLIVAAGALWAIIAPILAAAAPFIALGVAIGLVIDDIEKFRAGQASLIGEILERWPVIGRVARSVAEIVQMAWKLITDAIKWAASVITNEGIAAWNKYKSAFQPVVDMFEKAVGLVEKLWNWLAKFKDVPLRVIDWIGNKLSNLTGDHYDNAQGSPEQPRPTPDATVRLGNTASGRQIADKLVAMGWTPEQAAGIAGSFMQESGGKADALNRSSGAYGLGQWLGSRVADFKKYTGHDLQGSSLDEQLAFFNYEVTNGKEQSAGRRLRAATTAEEAADIHSRYYERPGAAEANNARREAFARNIFDGRAQVSAADTAPLATSPVATGATNNTRSTSVQVGDVHVHTPATDPHAVGNAVRDALRDHINNAIDQHDNSIAG